MKTIFLISTASVLVGLGIIGVLLFGGRNSPTNPPNFRVKKLPSLTPKSNTLSNLPSLSNENQPFPLVLEPRRRDRKKTVRFEETLSETDKIPPEQSYDEVYKQFNESYADDQDDEKAKKYLDKLGRPTEQDLPNVIVFSYP